MEKAVGDKVIIIRDVICRLSINATQASLRTLYPCIDALSSLCVVELSDGIEVVQIGAKALQRAEYIGDDTLQLTEASFQRMAWIRLLTIEDIHVWSIVTNRHHGNDTLTPFVPVIVEADERITLLDKSCRCSIILALKPIERNPVKAVCALLAANAYSGNAKLVVLGDIPVILCRRITVVLLHHDDITHSERVIQLAVSGIEPHLTRHWVVVVNLHHVREEPVAVLSQQLGYNHFEDT